MINSDYKIPMQNKWPSHQRTVLAEDKLSTSAPGKSMETDDKQQHGSSHFQSDTEVLQCHSNYKKTIIKHICLSISQAVMIKIPTFGKCGLDVEDSNQTAISKELPDWEWTFPGVADICWPLLTFPGSWAPWDRGELRSENGDRSPGLVDQPWFRYFNHSCDANRGPTACRCRQGPSRSHHQHHVVGIACGLRQTALQRI